MSAEPKKWHLFSRKQMSQTSPEESSFDEKESKSGDSEETSPELQAAPVPFLRLFRFSTRKELFLDFIGLCAAAAAGATQVGFFEHG